MGLARRIDGVGFTGTGDHTSVVHSIEIPLCTTQIKIQKNAGIEDVEVQKSLADYHFYGDSVLYFLCIGFLGTGNISAQRIFSGREWLGFILSANHLPSCSLSGANPGRTAWVSSLFGYRDVGCFFPGFFLTIK